MRSKTAKKIFSETSEETKEKVKQKTNKIIMKQTSVEFYHSELKKILYNVIVTPEQVLKMEDALTQAKEMENQQLKSVKARAIELLPKEKEVIEENNNGWIKIESEKDLPKENGHFLCIYKDGDIIPHYFSINSEFDKELFLQEFTHYQAVIKPQQPIF